MYVTKQVRVSKTHKMNAYFEKLCLNANNLYNTTCFYLRQYATAKYAFDEMKPLFEHQMEIYNLVEKVTADTKFHPRENIKWLNYNQLNYIFSNTENVDYNALPQQCNQQIIKLALRDFKSYFESIKSWKSNPSLFAGRPKMPRYHKSGGKSLAILTNQICVIKENGKLKFPLTKDLLDISNIAASGRLKEVRVKPHLVGFTIDVVLEEAFDGEIEPIDSEKLLTKYNDITALTERALAIDTGLSNLCTVVNNFGERPFIIKGTYLKSINQYYNKNMARYRSDAKKCNDLNWTLRMEGLTRNRNNKIKDYMHKATTYIVRYAKSNNVKIVVIGYNKLQKQEIQIGKVNNQNFVNIPFATLIKQLQYKLNKVGIELIVVEESYTSKASFENMDFLPSYGINDNNVIFSGQRIKRGLYRTEGKKPINADVNGAANIFRKAFPNVREWDSGIVACPFVVSIA